MPIDNNSKMMPRTLSAGCCHLHENYIAVTALSLPGAAVQTLASIGMNEKSAQQAGIDYLVFSEEFNGNDRALVEGESVGRIKLLLD